MRYSIIIPIFNEASALPNALKQLVSGLPDPSEVEIILSDGGSQDDSIRLAKQFPVNVIHSERGRALQMNAGALQTTGEWLIFLHADTILPSDWMTLIRNSHHDWGRFDVRLSGQHWLFRFIEKAMNFRSCTTAVATGDQALFFRREFFHKLGGFPKIPLMEDIAISKLARKISNPDCIRQTVITSSRRWEDNGIVRTIFMMWFLRLAYWLGFKPGTLQRLYYSE